MSIGRFFWSLLYLSFPFYKDRWFLKGTRHNTTPSLRLGVLIQSMIGIVITIPECRLVHMYDFEISHPISGFDIRHHSVTLWSHKVYPSLAATWGSMLSCKLGYTNKHDLQQKNLGCWHNPWKLEPNVLIVTSIIIFR